MRQMRIAIHRQAIRAQRQHLFQRAAESLQALPRQPIDQVDVDRTHAAVTARTQDVQRLLHALHAVDRFPHLRIEIPHAQAGPVEAQPCQHRHVMGIDEARIEFDRKIALRRIAEVEAPAQAFHQRGHRPGIEEVRRTAAQMQLDDLTAILELRCQQIGLGQHARYIAVATTAVAGDHPVAAAVETGTGTERHVHVQRQRAGQPVAVGDCLAQRRCVEAIVEVRCGRIRGVARAGRAGAAGRGRRSRPGHRRRERTCPCGQHRAAWPQPP